MKKGILLILLFCCAYMVKAQKVYAWMVVGVKAGYGLTGLLNTNLFDDRDYEHHISTGFTYGAKVGLYFGLYNGITADFMLSSNNQEFDYNRLGSSFIHNINWKNFDIAVLYRMQKDGLYVELGPQFSILQKVKNDDPNDERTDVTNFYNKNYISGVFGVGGYIFNYEQFTTMLGIRLGYGFGEMVTDEGKNLGFPTPSRVLQSEPKSTNAAYVQLVLEANFALGYYGRSSCSKRSTLFSF